MEKFTQKYLYVGALEGFHIYNVFIIYANWSFHMFFVIVFFFFFFFKKNTPGWFPQFLTAQEDNGSGFKLVFLHSMSFLKMGLL